MASPFQKYQGEQVQQIPAGYVEAMGSMGRAYQQIGASIAGGIQEADKRAQEEAKTRGGLKAYLKEDPRIKTVEAGISAGLLARGEDGTVIAVPGKEDVTRGAKSYIDFYNEIGGDGSKLTGAKFTEFISEFDASEKLRKERQAIQLAADKAKTEADLNKAKIDELNSRVAERKANAGIYGSFINGLGFGVGSVTPALAPLGLNIGQYNAPPVSDGTAVPELNRPVAPAATAPSATAPAAVPATQPTVPGAYTEGTSPASVPQAPVSGKPAAPAAPAKPVTATPAAPAAPAPTAAQKAETQAQVQTPAKAAPAPTAPITYDVPAKTVEVNARLAELDKKRVQVVDTFKTKRSATEGQIAIAKRNTTLPANAAGANMAKMTLDYNQNLLKGIDDAEAREIKRIDDEAQSVKTEFTNYQAAATAQRLSTTEQRLVAKAKEDTKIAEKTAQMNEEKDTRAIVEGYPVVGVFAHVGNNLRDPKTGKRVDPALVANIPKLNNEQINSVRETHTGYVSAQGFLIKMDDILRERSASGNEWKDRFRLTASNMKNYFEAELASVFGVATFRKAIVSGGNFSDADRAFVQSAITYLNTAAPDMSAEDLKSSLSALSGFINSMYMRSLESQGMRFAPESAKEQAAKLREYGAEGSADFIENNVKTTEQFYNRFGLKPTTNTNSKEFREAVDSARSTLWNALKKGKVDTSSFDGSSPEAMKGK
jgi:hypothetical protein